MEYCVGSRRNLKTATIAGVGFLATVSMEQAVLFALRAVNSLRIALIANVLKANIVIREDFQKVFECEFLHRGFLLFFSHRVIIPNVLPYVKGYSPTSIMHEI